MTTPLSLERAGNGFAAIVRLVADDQWDRGTSCDGWSVRALVGHVAAGSRMAAALAAGGSRSGAISMLGVDHLGNDPIGSIDTALAAQLEAFQQPGINEHIFQHPAGDMPGAQVLRFRVGDLLVHQWDLAQTIGADDTLDPALAQEVWDGIAPMIPLMAASGVFGAGPSGTVADDAPVQVRLLDAMGRRP
jgi:uncharacterized protein (TIGR03086 family)